MSLRRRVLLGFLLVAVALVATNVALASTFEDDLLRRTDEDLLETASRPVFAPTRDGRGLDVELLTDLYVGLANPDGTGLTRVGQGLDDTQSPPALTAEQMTAQIGTPFTVPSIDGDDSWRMVVLNTRGRPLLVVATELGEVETTLRRMRVIQVIGSAAVLGALGAVLWWVLRLGVRPLVAMAGTAEEIAAGDLTRRVDHVDEHTEAGRLGVTFNSMLDEIESAFRAREESETRLRDFAANASHELRTPLTSIRGYAELWEAGGLREPEQLDQAMRRLSAEGRRMGTLVEDLLLLARLDQQRPLVREPVRLDVLARDAAADTTAVEPDRPVTVDAEPVTVEADEAGVRQILANLVSNARIHTSAGTPIRVIVRGDGERARIEVADDGPGMSPEALSQVFQRFYRGDSSRDRVTGGSGLGLSIVDAVARAHGGTASASSTPGVGSTFVVELPRTGPTPT